MVPTDMIPNRFDTPNIVRSDLHQPEMGECLQAGHIQNRACRLEEESADTIGVPNIPVLPPSFDAGSGW